MIAQLTAPRRIGDLSAMAPKNAEVIVTGDSFRESLTGLSFDEQQKSTAWEALSKLGASPIDSTLKQLHRNPALLDGAFALTVEPATEEDGEPSFLLALRPARWHHRRALTLMQCSPIVQSVLRSVVSSDLGASCHGDLIHVADPPPILTREFHALHLAVIEDVVIVGNVRAHVIGARTRLLESTPRKKEARPLNIEIKRSATWRKGVVEQIIGPQIAAITDPLFNNDGEWHITLRGLSPLRVQLSLPFPSELPLQPTALAPLLGEEEIAVWALGLRAEAIAGNWLGDTADDATTPTEEQHRRFIDELDSKATQGILAAFLPIQRKSQEADRHQGDLAMLIHVPLSSRLTLARQLNRPKWEGTPWIRLDDAPVPPDGRSFPTEAGIYLQDRNLSWTNHASSFPSPSPMETRRGAPAALRGRIRLKSLAEFLTERLAPAIGIKDRVPSAAETRDMRRLIEIDIAKAAAGPLSRGEPYDVRGAIEMRLSLWRSHRALGSGQEERVRRIAELIGALDGVLQFEGNVTEGRLVVDITQHLE